MINYRYAMPTDIESVSGLLLEVSYVTNFLYGNTYKKSEIIEKISTAFISEEGKSSYKNFYVAEAVVGDTKKVIGFVAFYDSIHHKIDEKMKKLFSKKSLAVIEPLFHTILSNSFYIFALIVDESFRNLNIGQQLINHVIDQASKQDRTSVCLHVWDDNQKGIKFYLKNQFILYHNVILSTDSTLLPTNKKIHLAGINI